jgi:hypothetical protein
MAATAWRFARLDLMKSTTSGIFAPALALALVASLGACTTSFVSPVEVTRFTGSEPHLLGQGEIVVRAAPGQDPASLENRVFEDAVAAELTRLGYTVVQGDAPQVAEVRVERFVMQASGHSPVSVGVGAASGSAVNPRHGGVGAAVGIDLTPRPSDQIVTQMRVMIKPATGGTALWEGGAQFNATANSNYGSVDAAAGRLAGALFGGFPGQSGETIRVR